MSKLSIVKGKTSKLDQIYAFDGSGDPVKGLSAATSGLLWYYMREGAASPTAVTPTSGTVGTWTSAMFEEVSSANFPGIYEIGLPDAMLSTGVDWVTSVIHGGGTMKPVSSQYHVSTFDIDSTAPDVNVLQISSDATAANNAELFFDGTGYAGGTTKLQVDAVAVSGDTTAADNLELDYDGTGYAKTNSTIGTVTTLTGKTGFSLSATGLDSITQAATGMIEIAKAVWDRVLTGATHNISTSAGRRLRQTEAASVVFAGTASAGGSDSITLTGGSATDGLYVGAGVSIVGGTGAGQSRYIVTYDGTTKIAVVARAWTTAPDGTSEFAVTHDHQIDFVDMGVAQAGGATSITLASTASATDDLYTGTTVRLFSGTGDGQIRMITAYNGTTKVATIAPAWEVNPDSTSSYATLNIGPSNAVAISGDATASDNLETMLDGTGGNALTAAFTGNLTGSAAAITGAVGSVTGNVGGNLVGSIGSLGATAKVDVNDQVVDGLTIDTIPELGQAALPSTPTFAEAVMAPYMLLANSATTTASAQKVFNAAGTNIYTKLISFASSTLRRDKTQAGT